MQIEVLKISELVPYDKNPRINKHAVDAVANSLREFGFKQPIVIDDNNVLVCGHTRLKAAKKLKIKEVPCVRASELSEEQKKAYRIADNSTAALAEWDMDLLAVEVGEIEMDLTQFGLEPLQDAEELPEVVEDEAPEVDESTPPVAQLGDIWELGRHRLMCGDSTDAGSVALLMGGVKADVIFCDPPYGIGLDKENQTIGKSKKYGAVLNDNNTDVARKVIEQNKGRFKFCFFWGANYYADILPPSSCWVIWDKQDGKHVTYADVEMCWTNMEKPARKFKHIWDGFRRDSERGENRLHINQKPVKLIQDIFNFFELPINILDLFGGSGSTLIACEQTERKCFMMELSENYCDVILKRYQNLTGDEPTLNGKKFMEVQHERQTT